MIENWNKRMECAWQWLQWIWFYYRLGPAQRLKILGKQPSRKKGLAN